MLTFLRSKSVRIMLVLVCCCNASGARANGTGYEFRFPEEMAFVDVVVNVANGADVNEIEFLLALFRASDILWRRAGITLLPKYANTSARYGDSDPNLTEEECREAQRLGEQELDRICGPGKGLKITIADVCDVNIPNDVRGLAIHGNPVIILKPNVTKDPNEGGKTLAHEICHALTIEDDLYDSNDPNNLMWWQEGSGTELDANQVQEIFRRARQRGRGPYTDGMNYWRPENTEWKWSVDAHGSILDSFSDVTASSENIDPLDPKYAFADMRAISIFSNDLGQLNAKVTFEVQLGGPYPVGSSFDAIYEAAIEKDDDSDVDAMLRIHVWQYEEGLNSEALYEDFDNGRTSTLPLRIRENNLLGCPGGYEKIANHSVEVAIPADFFGPGCEPFADRMEFSIYATTKVPDPAGGMPGDNVVLYDASDEPVRFKITNPAQCPGVTFGGNPFAPDPLNPDMSSLVIFGCGFSGDVEIMIDYKRTGIAAADDEGKFSYCVAEASRFDAGMHLVVAKELAGDVSKGANLAAAYLYAIPVIGGDLDRDGDVDFTDFAILANNWLEGS